MDPKAAGRNSSRNVRYLTLSIVLLYILYGVLILMPNPRQYPLMPSGHLEGVKCDKRGAVSDDSQQDEDYAEDDDFDMEDLLINPREAPPRLFHVSRFGSTVEGVFLATFRKKRFINVKRKGSESEVSWQDSIDMKSWQFKHFDKNCGGGYEYAAGACEWCSQDDPTKCGRGGRLTFFKLPDEDVPSDIDTPEFNENMAFRPAHCGAAKKSLVQTVFVRCSDITPPAQVGVRGFLTVQNLTSFVQFVNPRKGVRGIIRRNNVVCTDPLWGKKLDPVLLEKFVVHYLRTWKFSVVYLYEIGLTFQTLIKDVVFQSDVLYDHYVNGELIIVDLRDELQRMYGPIAANLVMYAKDFGRPLINADCLLRAKTDASKWVLFAGWTDLLSHGTKLQSVDEAIAKYFTTSSKDRTSKLIVPRIASMDKSFCDCSEAVWTQKGDIGDQSKLPPIEPDQKQTLLMKAMNDYIPRSEYSSSRWAGSVECAYPAIYKSIRVPREELYIAVVDCVPNSCPESLRNPQRVMNWAERFWNEPPPPGSPDAASAAEAKYTYLDEDEDEGKEAVDEQETELTATK